MTEMNQALSGDLDGEFPALVTEMGPRLYWGLRRMCGDHQEAEDLTQETFIRAYRAMSEFDQTRLEQLRLAPWLWTIALNLGRNHMRDRSRRPSFVPMADQFAEDPEVPDGDAWDARLASLNSHQKTAVVLRHVVGMNITEISEATGRAEGTVKADIHRGLARLRIRMEHEE